MPFFKKMQKEFEHLELILGLPKEEHILDNALPKLIIIGNTQFKKIIIEPVELSQLNQADWTEPIGIGKIIHVIYWLSLKEYQPFQMT